MSRPGFVTYLEKNSPPMMFNAGDAFHYEKLPEGTRVIYPPGPRDPLPDPNVAIDREVREALHPAARLRPLDFDPVESVRRADAEDLARIV